MREEQIREAFLQAGTDAETDQRVLEKILGGREMEPVGACGGEWTAHTRRQGTRDQKAAWRKGIAAAAVLAALLFGAAQIPQVATYADSAIEYFTAIFRSDGLELRQEGGFLQISGTAGTKWQKFETLSQVEEEAGLTLLKYDGADEGRGSWAYYAATENSKLGMRDIPYEFFFTNHCYVLGDLRNVSVERQAMADTMNTIRYEPGEVYRSPISCQIVVLTDRYKELSGDRDLDDGVIEIDTGGAEAKRYYCENLDTEVLIYETYTDGPAAWDQVKSVKTACMKFYYKGIYYNYMGQVDTETMLEFARALHE